MIVIEGCAVATVDGEGSEHSSGHLVVEEERIVAVGPGPAPADLLRRSPEPSDDEIREALSGNLCRCTGYEKIFDAVRLAAQDGS